jgi:hypothetical protein
MSTGWVNTIKRQGDELFGKRDPLLSLFQDIAENYYPERADFTNCRSLGEELARNLMTSYPVMARRDLGNLIGGMLRPNAKEWFHTAVRGVAKVDTEQKQWLEYMAGFQRRAMYDRAAQFARATKEADHDFSAFGNAVLSVEINPARDGLLYRCWHLRDCAWVEDETGQVSTLHRKWKPTAQQLVRFFPQTVHQKVRDKLEKDPFAEINVRHIVMRADDWEAVNGDKKIRQPWVSVYLDCDHDHVLEVVGQWVRGYIVPRWQTVSGSQYGMSPAAVVGLPDARTLQSMTRVILEAGEKATNPPMIAVKDAIRSDIAIYAGGVTWVDAEYDEKLGEVLRPISQDKSGMGVGLEMLQDLRGQMAEAWYLNKLNLPPQGGPDMTAYEVGQRVQEFIRNALPLFEPLEMDYNGQLCEMTFELLLRNTPELMASIPRSLRGADIEFNFESPLRDAIERAKLGQFLEAQQVLATAVQLDPTTGHLVDAQKATREVLEAVAPAEWLRTKRDVEQRVQQQAQMEQEQMAMQQMNQGAQTAKTLAEAQRIAGADAGVI